MHRKIVAQSIVNKELVLIDMKKIFSILLLTVIVFNSYAGGRKAKEDIKVKLNYNLPLRVLDVKVCLERTVYTKGIFIQYAEKYLGVSPNELITENREEWALSTVSIDTHEEIDPKAFFSINTSKNYKSLKLFLSPEGYLAGFNTDLKLESKEKESTFINHQSQKVKDIVLERFCLDRPFKVVEDTSLIIVEENGEATQHSKVKGKRIAKTVAQKAADAAHIIFKLRKRRFKILTCNYKQLPKDGKSYQEIIKNLNALEQRYLELFFGKQRKFKQNKSFTVRPIKDKKSVTITRYSNAKGFVGNNDLSSIPIVLEFKNVSVNNKSRLLSTETYGGNYLFYRVPARVDVQVFNGKTIIGQKNIVIPQLGNVAKISTDVLIDQNYSVDFYPQLGSIKRVYSK